MTRNKYIVEKNNRGEEIFYCKECGCPMDECCCNTTSAVLLDSSLDGNIICTISL